LICFMDALLDYSNFQLKNGDEHRSKGCCSYKIYAWAEGMQTNMLLRVPTI
jgi:hypothetical protein